MSIDTMMRQVVTVLTPGDTTDVYGNVVDGWTSPTTVTTKGLVEFGLSTEVTVGRDTVIADAKAFLPVDTVINALDRVVVAGRTFEVIGLPALWDQGSPATRHIEAQLRTLVSG